MLDDFGSIVKAMKVLSHDRHTAITELAQEHVTEIEKLKQKHANDFGLLSRQHAQKMVAVKAKSEVSDGSWNSSLVYALRDIDSARRATKKGRRDQPP